MATPIHSPRCADTAEHNVQGVWYMISLLGLLACEGPGGCGVMSQKIRLEDVVNCDTSWLQIKITVIFWVFF